MDGDVYHNDYMWLGLSGYPEMGDFWSPLPPGEG